MAIPIYVIGSSNTDMVVNTEKLPLPGETVMGTNFFMNPGGKGANQAVAAARLGGQVTFVAKVGEDLFGNQALQQFQRENIITTYITKDSDHPSGVALIGVDSQGENCIMVAPGSNAHLDVKIVEQALDSIQGPAIILLQLEIPLRTVEFAIQKGKSKGCKVILNPAPVQPVDVKVLPDLYMITPNEFEAERLTGIRVIDVTSAEQAAQALHKLGVPNVAITLGAKGVYLHSDTVAKLIPAPSVTPLDTTAAGDCFNGALAVALAEGLDLTKSVSFASFPLCEITPASVNTNLFSFRATMHLPRQNYQS